MTGKWTKQIKEKEHEKALELMNQKVTYLDEQQQQRLQDLMNKSPKANEALKKLMNEKHDVEVDIDEIQSNN